MTQAPDPRAGVIACAEPRRASRLAPRRRPSTTSPPRIRVENRLVGIPHESSSRVPPTTTAIFAPMNPAPAPPPARSRLPRDRRPTEHFEAWLNNRSVASFGSNAGAPSLAFQRWHHFKEAFPPELIRRAFAGNPAAKSFLDPFGGSGTTALAAQFLGIPSTTVEVNPYLADLIRAKTSFYNSDHLASLSATLKKRAARMREPALQPGDLPQTFIEPGHGERWLFNADVAHRVAILRAAIETIPEPHPRRLFSVLLGGILVDVSNATISGKGRRYRRNWNIRKPQPDAVDRLFFHRVRTAITDIHRYRSRPQVPARIIHGDARNAHLGGPSDIAVFSPPYPNSFDYTDVYNIELWMLGYLQSSSDNQALRHSTLSSHVQLYREFADPPASPLLRRTLDGLLEVRSRLWSPWIPQMIGAYFGDLALVLRRVSRAMSPDSEMWIVIGDSRYAGVHISSAQILCELAPAVGWTLRSLEPIRAMRASAQQGGATELAETLLVFVNSPPPSASDGSSGADKPSPTETAPKHEAPPSSG
jgi:hypothetical protein